MPKKAKIDEKANFTSVTFYCDSCKHTFPFEEKFFKELFIEPRPKVWICPDCKKGTVR